MEQQRVHTHPHSNHSHKHDGHHQHSSSTKRLTIAIIIIVIFAGIEALGGWWANSLTLLSDAGHMLADALSLLLAAFAAWVASKPPSPKHSFGYGRAEVIGACFSSILLVGLVIFIAVEAIERLSRGEHPVDGRLVTLIAFIGLLSNIAAAYILSKGEKNLNIRAAILHILGDMLGSFCAIIAGIVIMATGWLPIDAILSLLISVLILIASIRLLRETFSVLMESVPAHLELATIGASMATLQGVKSIHDLHIWYLSSSNIMLTAHVDIDTLQEWPQLLSALKLHLASQFSIHHITLQPEVSSRKLYQLPEN